MNGKTALVVAHPDDEILWFSSILKKVDIICICFLEHPSQPTWTEGRKAALARFPVPNVISLKLPAAEVFNCADWIDPKESPSGLMVQNKSGTSHKARRYAENYHRMVAALEAQLEGIATVFTHNPWGEYAHEEHVQVFRAIEYLKQKIGYEIWISSYFSHRSYRLMMKNVNKISSVSERRETDVKTSEEIMKLYMETGCWTWFDNWKWPQTEVFFRYGHDNSSPIDDTALLPLNMVNVPPVNKDEESKGILETYIRKLKSYLIRRKQS